MTGTRLGQWLLRERSLLSVVAGGVLLSVAMWFGADYYWDQPNARTELAALGDNRRLLLQSTLDDLKQSLQVMESFVEATPGTMTLDTFDNFIRNAESVFPRGMEIDWAARVPAAARAEHERQAESEGIPGYRIRELDAAGNPKPVGDREEYFPIRFSASSVKTPPPLGLDVSGHDIEAAAMAEARDTGEFVSLPLSPQPTDAGPRLGIVGFVPTYRPDLREATLADRRLNLQGFVRAVLIPETVLARPVRTVSPRGIDIQFFASGAPGDAMPFYVRSSLLRKTPAEPLRRDVLEAGLHWTGELRFLDTPMTMIVVPMARGPLATDHGRAWVGFAAGLTLTLALMAFLRIRERSARRLQLAKSLLEAEIESSPDGVLVIEHLHGTASFNGRFCDLLGIPAELRTTNDSDKLLAAALPKLKHPEDLLQPFLVRSEEPIHRQTALRDGRVIEVHSVALQPRLARSAGRIWFVRDVTDRVTTEEAVRRSEERYRSLVETTMDSLWEIDANGCYTFISPSIPRLIGYEPSEMLGKMPFDFMPPAEATRVRALFRDIAAQRRPFSLLEATVLRKDGTILTIETSGMPIIDENGTLKGYRGIDRDVSARKRAEAIVEYRGALLHAVAAAATELATSVSTDEAISKALKTVGEAVRVDRVLVLENVAKDALPAVRFAWHSPFAPVTVDARTFAEMELGNLGTDPWFAAVAEGKHAATTLSAAGGRVRELLVRLGIKSILVMPLMIDNRPWGQIGFDDCRNEREWTNDEIDILRTVGDVVCTSLMRARYVRELSDASTIVESSPTVLYRLRGEPGLPMIYVSRNVKQLSYDAEALLASPHGYMDYVHPDDLTKVSDWVVRVSEPGSRPGVLEYRIRGTDNRYRCVENRYTPVRDASGRLLEIEGTLVDITERKEVEAKIAQLARTDPLTGLANRTTFTDRLRQVFASAKRGGAGFAVLYLDLDHFKDVNDTLGHPAGDELLKQAAARLQRSLRETDLVARLGGDEFAILQTEVAEAADSGTLAEHVRAVLAAPYQIAGNAMHLTASVGIASYTRATVKPDDIMGQADLALYRAKDEGRNQYRFHDETLDRKVRDRLTLNDELRHAVEAEQLEIYYQPQIKLLTGEIVGIEALIRWHHPTRGLLLPADFLSAAEQTGTIVPLGRWMRDRACKQMSEWRQAGIAPATIALNLSLAELRSGPELVDEIVQTLARWGLQPGDLEIDVTELTLAHATLAQNDLINRLRQLGVIVAIDDFGTQYSSLDYLKSYQVSRLKIPHALLRSAPLDPGNAAMVRAIVGIAGQLQIEVVAQGIETESQRNFLSATTEQATAQGFYYSEAVSADRATELLRRKKIDRPEAPAPEAVQAAPAPGAPPEDRRSPAMVPGV
jgi:diguanylate cyclase (GGDEF)-like protein/PAS domain S-box-containing protein